MHVLITFFYWQYVRGLLGLSPTVLYTSLWTMCWICFKVLDCGFLPEGLGSVFLQQSKGCDAKHFLKCLISVPLSALCKNNLPIGFFFCHDGIQNYCFLFYFVGFMCHGVLHSRFILFGTWFNYWKFCIFSFFFFPTVFVCFLLPACIYISFSLKNTIFFSICLPAFCIHLFFFFFFFATIIIFLTLLKIRQL